MNAAEATVDALTSGGVRSAFTVPGESFLGLLDALSSSRIRVVATRHEAGAAFMAEATAKLTGAPVLCMATRAPGASNLAIGLHTALHDSSPVVAIVGQVRRAVRLREGFQEVDLAAMLRPLTKWAVEVADGEQLVRSASEACRRAVTGRPGPVALVVPEDVFADEVAAWTRPSGQLSPRSGAPASVVRDVLAGLRAAERPIFIVGGGVLRAGATTQVVALAEQTHTPVVTAFRRHDAFPNDHDLYLGSLSLGVPNVTRDEVRRADYIVALGTRLGELTTDHYSIPSANARLVHVDVDTDALAKNAVTAVPIAADVGHVVDQLASGAAAYAWPSRPHVAVARREWTKVVAAPNAQAGSHVASPARIVAAVSAKTQTGVVTSDAGNFSAWVSRHITRSRPMTFLGPTSGAMGYAVPAAVAAGLLGRSPVVAFCGDGGFLMTSAELATARKEGMRMTCVVFDNARFGTIQMHQELRYPGRRVATDLWSPDFGQYGRAFDAATYQIASDDDIDDVLEDALAWHGVSLIHVPTQSPPYLPPDV